MNCCPKSRGRSRVLPEGTVEGQFLESDVTPSSWTLPEDVIVGDVGEVLTASAADVAAFAAPPGLAITAWHYLFGAQQVNTGTQALFPFFSTSAGTNPIASAAVTIVPFAGTVRTMYVTHGTPVGADNIVYTVMINGVASALTVTLNSGNAGPGTNLVATPAVAAGDRLTLRTTGPTANRACKPRVQFLLV